MGELKNVCLKTALTIAGSDCSGGAGIQADVKTMQANGVYAMSAITAVTAQNTMAVKAVMKIPPQIFKQQLECVCADIPPDAVKIGMMPDKELAKITAETLRKYHMTCVVYDPVMVASLGNRLMEEDSCRAICEQLLPLATLVTPNIEELEILSGRKVKTKEQMQQAAELVRDQYHCAVLCKGGHLQNEDGLVLEESSDLLCEQEGQVQWFVQTRIDNPNTHGTGCTLSAAIAANLAKGFLLPKAVARAKQYMTGCICAGLNLGAGAGPMHHGFDLQSEFL